MSRTLLNQPVSAGANTSAVLMDVNANGNPYIRWTKTDGTAMQVLFSASSKSISMQRNNGSGWETVWTMT